LKTLYPKSVKSIDQLLHEKGSDTNFDSFKIPVAKRLSLWISEEIDESMHDKNEPYNGKRIPTSKSFPDFVGKLGSLTEKMKKYAWIFIVVK